jgi:pimeloyl-ACP methyl ester carboxylesterase
LVLLPGLGGDERLFEPQRDAFPDLEVPAWIEPLRGETLAAYAARMAQRVGAGGPLYLGGVSFGAIVALEMARHRREPVSDRELRVEAAFRHGRALACSCGCSGARRTCPRPPRPGLSVRPVSPAQKDLFFSMLLKAPAHFMKWGILATLGWSPAGLPYVPVHQIHGSDDTLLPVRLAEPQHVVRAQATW